MQKGDEITKGTSLGNLPLKFQDSLLLFKTTVNCEKVVLLSILYKRQLFC